MKLLIKNLVLTVALLTLVVSCGKDDNEDSTLPKVKTKEISTIRTRSATGGGIVESRGNSDVTQRGVCWSKNPNPTLLDAYTIDSSGLGSFNSSLTGLLPDTEYFVRAYAVNNAGIAYGNQVVFKTLTEVIPSENFWYVGERPFIVNALGTLWTGVLKTFGALSTESGGVINIQFKDRPVGASTYKVVKGTTKKEELADDECFFVLIYPGFSDNIIISSGKEGNSINCSVSTLGKLRVSFNDVELIYSTGGEDKFTSTRGILVEK